MFVYLFNKTHFCYYFLLGPDGHVNSRCRIRKINVRNVCGWKWNNCYCCNRFQSKANACVQRCLAQFVEKAAAQRVHFLWRLFPFQHTVVHFDILKYSFFPMARIQFFSQACSLLINGDCSHSNTLSSTSILISDNSYLKNISYFCLRISIVSSNILAACSLLMETVPIPAHCRPLPF